jgi:archaetidylinositol phosphate synthase
MNDPKSHIRVNDILLGPLERPALHWLAARMPAWVNPDLLTGIGVLGAVITFISYGLSNGNANYLWLADVGLVINWFGDSLDGTLARFRHVERPRYGFFVDHTVDALSEVLIVLGLGLSPFVRFEIASLALIGYLLMSVLVYVRTYVDGIYRISYGRFGPTEVRVILILINLMFFFADSPMVTLPTGLISIYDLVIAVLAVLLFLIFAVSSARQAQDLAKLDE